MTQTIATPQVNIDARYDGSCGFVYVGNARAFFNVTMERTTAGTRASVSFNQQYGDLSPVEAQAVYAEMRAYMAKWTVAQGYRVISEGR